MSLGQTQRSIKRNPDLFFANASCSMGWVVAYAYSTIKDMSVFAFVAEMNLMFNILNGMTLLYCSTAQVIGYEVFSIAVDLRFVFQWCFQPGRLGLPF